MAPLCKGSCRAKGETEGLFFGCYITFITAALPPTPHPSALPTPSPEGKANNVLRFFGRGGACSSRTKRCYFVPEHLIRLAFARHLLPLEKVNNAPMFRHVFVGTGVLDCPPLPRSLCSPFYKFSPRLCRVRRPRRTAQKRCYFVPTN